MFRPSSMPITEKIGDTEEIDAKEWTYCFVFAVLCSVDMKVHQNTMDPVIFDFVRKVCFISVFSCRVSRTFTRSVQTCLQWNCAFVRISSVERRNTSQSVADRCST